MVSSNHQRPASILRRLRPRFRLRTGFLLITVLCIWLGVSMERKYREEKTLRVIASAGGGSATRLSWFYPFRSVYIVAFSGREFTDAELATVVDALADLPSLDYLQIVNTSVTDAGLVHIRSLDAVRTLDLWGTPVTDEGVEHVLSLRYLRHLDLSATLISDTSVALLAELDRLETLTLPPSAGLRPTAGPQPPEIQALAIQANRSFSAPGVVSRSAIQDLRNRLPGCSIRQGNGYNPPRKSLIIPNPIPYELR